MTVNDHDIVEALLKRNERLTREFFYRRCYPLFKSVYDNYHTDSTSCLEFINEIYIYVLTPSKTTGQCKLEQFRFQSTLFTWLKTVVLFYCYRKYARRKRINEVRISEKYDDEGVRIDTLPDSINAEDMPMAGSDAETILRLMPNRRYSLLIRLRYLEGHSNEETARLMGMNMNTYYNKHNMAKAQYIKTLRKEEKHDG